MDFNNLNIDETFKRLNTSINGLNNEEVTKRRQKYGLNTFYFNNEFLKLFLLQILNPIVFTLLIALILTLINKSYSDSIYISIVILITIIFNIILEYKNEYPINFEKLRTKKVWVIRNGKKTKISSKKITIGDIIIIEKNNFIKADIKVIVANDIKINSPLNNIYSEKNSILLAGDFVIEGSGMGVVLEIGKNTKIYKLAHKTSQKRNQKLPFKIYLDKKYRQNALFSLIIAIFLSLILYIKKIEFSSAITYLISLIISSIPIFLIVVLVLILYYFKIKNNKNVTINSLNTLSSIGDVTTIICNKEDILTLNEIIAEIVELEDGSIYKIEGAGYNDVGKIIPVNPSAKYKDSLYNLNLLGKLISINNKAKLEYINEDWQTCGNPYDIALLSLNQRINHCIFENKIVYEIDNNDYIVTFYKENDITKVSIKGNVEEVLKFCNNDYEEILRRYNYLKSLGYKVIGVAEGKIPKSKQRKKYCEKDIKNLSFIGLIGFINPLKNTTKDTIKLCEKESIRVIVTTDEDENTAEIFGKELNLISKRNEIATDEDITHNFNLGERIFDDFVKDIKILSNVSNENLIKVIDSLKRSKKIIGYVGNDINDINILKNSDISITTNNSLIKCSSDLTINDNNLESIIDCIKNGKNICNTIYNIMNYLYCCNIMTFITIFLCSTFKNSNVLSINQIIYINLISCILALGPLLNCTQKIIYNKKEWFKWILISIFNTIIILLFTLLLNKINIEQNDINSSIVFLINFLQIILLFYYQDKTNSIFKLNLKEKWKTYLFIIILLLIQFLIFKLIIGISYIIISIILGYSLMSFIVIEIINKIKSRNLETL